MRLDRRLVKEIQSAALAAPMVGGKSYGGVETRSWRAGRYAGGIALTFNR